MLARKRPTMTPSKPSTFKRRKTQRKRFPLYRTRYSAYGSENSFNNPFPAIKKCQLVYASTPNITITSGYGRYQIACNDLYDPDATGTGDQPAYFDQLMEIYNHFVVTSSFIEIQILATGVSKALYLNLYCDDDTTNPNSPVNMQRPGALTVATNPAVEVPPNMRLGWSAARNFGPNVLNNTLFRGNASTSPTERMFYVLNVNDAGLTTFDLPCRIKVTFNAVFTERKTITGS